MNKSQTTQIKFIENILLNAAKNKMSKLDTIGSLEMSKLLFNDNAKVSYIDEAFLISILGEGMPTHTDFIKNVLTGLTKMNISKLEATGLLETTKLMIYKTDFGT